MSKISGNLLEHIRKALTVHILRESLNCYFSDKELTKDDYIYPPAIRDIADSVPILSGRVEVVPYMEEINPTTNWVKVGWNLFVLGNQRIFLGHTIHESLAHMERAAVNEESMKTSIRKSTADEITKFIIENILKHDVDLYPLEQYGSPAVNAAKIPTTGAFYERNKQLGQRI